MKETKNKFIKDFQIINLTEFEQEKIKDNIYHKYKNHQKRKKYILSFSIILFICLTYIGVSFADEINEYFKVKDITCKNGETSTIGRAKLERKIINYDADIPEHKASDKPIEYTFQEIEDLINIKLVKNSKIPDDKINLRNCIKENGKIASISFNHPFTHGKDNRINYNASLITKYHTGNDISEWNTENNLSADEFILKKLNTKVYILQFRDEPWTSSMYQFIFIYDDVTYWGIYVSHKPQGEERKKDVLDFLDSFYI